MVLHYSLVYLILFNLFLLGQYLVLYSALLSCLEYRFYSLIFPVLLSVANKTSFIRSFIHSFIRKLPSLIGVLDPLD